MTVPEENENCHYIQNDPQGCKIKVEKFYFHVLYYRMAKIYCYINQLSLQYFWDIAR